MRHTVSLTINQHWIRRPVFPVPGLYLHHWWPSPMTHMKITRPYSLNAIYVNSHVWIKFRGRHSKQAICGLNLNSFDWKIHPVTLGHWIAYKNERYHIQWQPTVRDIWQIYIQLVCCGHHIYTSYGTFLCVFDVYYARIEELKLQSRFNMKFGCFPRFSYQLVFPQVLWRTLMSLPCRHLAIERWERPP